MEVEEGHEQRIGGWGGKKVQGGCQTQFRLRTAFYSHKLLCIPQFKIIIIITISQPVTAHAFEPSTPEAETRVEVQSGLQSEFLDSQDYTENPVMRKNKIDDQLSMVEHAGACL